MADVDINTLMLGMLRLARAKPDPVAWLTSLSGEATEAIIGGDIFVNSTAYKGQSSGMQQRFNAQQLLQLTELCLARLKAEEGTGGPDMLPLDASLTYGVFS